MSYTWYRVSALSESTRRPVRTAVTCYSLAAAEEQAAKWDGPNVLVIITPVYH